MIERRGISKHVAHIRHLGCIKRQRLVERRGTKKHATHIRHPRRVPLVYRRIKRRKVFRLSKN